MKATCRICEDKAGNPVEVEFDSQADRDRWVTDHVAGHSFFTDDPAAGHGAVVMVPRTPPLPHG